MFLKFGSLPLGFIICRMDGSWEYSKLGTFVSLLASSETRISLHEGQDWNNFVWYYHLVFLRVRASFSGCSYLAEQEIGNSSGHLRSFVVQNTILQIFVPLVPPLREATFWDHRKSVLHEPPFLLSCKKWRNNKTLINMC